MRRLLTIEIEEGDEGSLYINTALNVSHDEGGLDSLIDNDDVYTSLDEVFGYLHDVMKNLDYEQQYELLQPVDDNTTPAEYRDEIARLAKELGDTQRTVAKFGNLLVENAVETIEGMDPELRHYFWTQYAPDLRPRILKAFNIAAQKS